MDPLFILLDLAIVVILTALLGLVISWISSLRWPKQELEGPKGVSALRRERFLTVVFGIGFVLLVIAVKLEGQ